MSFQNAFIGSLVADAVSMPVHWYYNARAIDQDYGDFDHFLPPQNPHPDSILWRSKYETTNEKDDILHEQSKYWGQKGIHYHQFLKAGENSLNLKLACELYRTIIKFGEFNNEAWLERYAEVSSHLVGTVTLTPRNTTGLFSKTMPRAKNFPIVE